jgi:hypothetical protein
MFDDFELKGDIMESEEIKFCLDKILEQLKREEEDVENIEKEIKNEGRTLSGNIESILVELVPYDKSLRRFINQTCYKGWTLYVWDLMRLCNYPGGDPTITLCARGNALSDVPLVYFYCSENTPQILIEPKNLLGAIRALHTLPSAISVWRKEINEREIRLRNQKEELAKDLLEAQKELIVFCQKMQELMNEILDEFGKENDDESMV